MSLCGTSGHACLMRQRNALRCDAKVMFVTAMVALCTVDIPYRAHEMLQYTYSPLYAGNQYRSPDFSKSATMAFDDESSNNGNNKGTVKKVLKPATKGNLGPGSGSSAVAGTAQSSNRAPNAWDMGGTNALKTSLANSRNPNQALRGAPIGGRPKSTLNIMMNFQTPSVVAAKLGNMNINGAQTQDWKPNDEKLYKSSEGPTGSTMTKPWRDHVAASEVSSTRSIRPPYLSEFCKTTNYSRRHFRLGEVITVPYHTSNTNPHVDPDDDRLILTVVGPAYSKKRMMVVLFIHIQDMYCLPLYSFSNRGLQGKPEHLKKEYVCMANDGDEGFVNQGIHRPVIIQAHHRVYDNTTVHLTGGVRVGCNEWVHSAGRLTRDSYYELVGVWSDLVSGAKAEVWRE